jgi:hypothetical protein
MAFLRRQKKPPGPCAHQLQGPLPYHPAGQPSAKDKLSADHIFQTDFAEVSTTTDHEQANVSLDEDRDCKGRCKICRAEQLAARRYRTKLIIGLFCPFALQALDVTIVASALPWIASDFSKSCWTGHICT